MELSFAGLQENNTTVINTGRQSFKQLFMAMPAVNDLNIGFISL